MPNGIWKIASTLPQRAGKPGTEYLPDGTRVRLLIQGATANAMAEQRTDELFAMVGVLPPWTPELCRTGVAVSTSFGANLCDANGQPLAPKDATPADLEATAVFSRLSARQVADQDEIFFTDLGAKAGARLMTLTLKYKGVTWDFWLKSPTLMISEAYINGDKRSDVESFPMFWHREA
ncbi:MAG: hypothetical protein ABJD97_08125 [Betaproteobacteria bacterium]